MTAKVSL